MGPISVKPLERSFNLNCAIIRPGVIMSNSPVLSSVRSILLSPRGFSPLASATARLETGAVHVLLVSRLRMRSHVYVSTYVQYVHRWYFLRFSLEGVEVVRLISFSTRRAELTTTTRVLAQARWKNRPFLFWTGRNSCCPIGVVLKFQLRHARFYLYVFFNVLWRIVNTRMSLKNCKSSNALKSFYRR